MRRYLSTILTILASALFLSCEKDQALKKRFEGRSSKECVNHLKGCTVSNYRVKKPAYERVIFEPVHGDELIIQRVNRSSEREILKFELETGKSTVIKEQIRSASDLSWSTTGWIAFSTASNWNIWKMREDGSGLTQLSNTPRDLSPEFHPDGNKLIYSRNMDYGPELDNDPQLRYQYKVMLIDLNGDSLDSFCRKVGDDPCYPWSRASWAPDGERIAAPDGSVAPNKGLALYDLDGERLSYEFDFVGDQITSIGDIEWHPNNERIYFTYSNGYKDINGAIAVWFPSRGQTRIMRKGCEDHFYRDFTISPDGQQLVAIRRDSEYEDCEVTTKAKPVIMDIDGGNERVLEIE